MNLPPSLEMTLTFSPDHDVHDVQSYEIFPAGTCMIPVQSLGGRFQKKKMSCFYCGDLNLECVYFISGFRKAAFVFQNYFSSVEDRLKVIFEIYNFAKILLHVIQYTL